MRPLALLSRLSPDRAPAQAEDSRESDHEKAPGVSTDDRSTDDGHSPERVAEDAQAGVQKIEATTSVWTKNALIVTYVMSVPWLTSLRAARVLTPPGSS